jgi:hypothetical protein
MKDDEQPVTRAFLARVLRHAGAGFGLRMRLMFAGQEKAFRRRLEQLELAERRFGAILGGDDGPERLKRIELLAQSHALLQARVEMLEREIAAREAKP